MQQSDTRSIDPPWRLVRLGPRDGDRYCDHLMRLDATDRRFRFFEEPPDHLIALHAGFAASDGRTLHACESEARFAASESFWPTAKGLDMANWPSASNGTGGGVVSASP